MAAYFTFHEKPLQEGIIQDVKDRVQTNLGNAANAVQTGINAVKKVGYGIAGKATSAANTVSKAANAIGAKGFTGPTPPPAAQQPQITNIKRQVPNGAKNTTRPLSNGGSVLARGRQMLG